MSNIAYRIPNDSQIFNKGLSKLVIRVDTGSISINPGRESLSLDQATITTINQHFERIADEIVTIADDHIAAAPDDFTRIKIVQQFLKALPKELSKKLTVNFNSPSISLSMPNYSWSAPDLDFCDTTLPFTVGILNYRSRPRKDVHFDAKCLTDYHILAIDVKTNYSHAIQSTYSKYSNILVFYPIDKTTFRESFDQWVESVGIPASNITYASSIVSSPTVKSTPRDAGIYVCKVNSAALTIATGTLATESSYIYMESSGSVFTDPNYEELLYLHSALFSRGVTMPQLVAVQKKYLSSVVDMPSFTPARTYLTALANSLEWDVYEPTINYDKVYATIPSNIPLLSQLAEEYAAFRALDRSNFINEPHFSKFSHLITSTVRRYALTHSFEEATAPYPLFYHFNHSYSSNEASLYLTIQAFYNANSNQGKSQSCVSNE